MLSQVCFFIMYVLMKAADVGEDFDGMIEDVPEDESFEKDSSRMMNHVPTILRQVLQLTGVIVTDSHICTSCSTKCDKHRQPDVIFIRCTSMAQVINSWLQVC